MSYKSLIRLIQDGDNVNADTINRVLRSFGGNITYLKDILESALMGEAIFAREVTIEADALLGQPVYFNAATQQFERGLAGATVDQTTGALMTSAASQIWGIVSYKHNSTLADVLLRGYATLSLDNAVDADLEAGIYYLSGSTPGKLVRQKPPVTVAVLQSDGNGQIYVSPQFYEALEQHKHYNLPLRCVPAGNHTPPTPGERHVVTDGDDSIEGWLPADHASFDGNAPEGAAFGYNIAASGFASLWPPLPIEGVYLEWNKGTDLDVGGTGVPLGQNGLCVVDQFGIWWMSDCYQDVPWPAGYDTEDISSESDGSISIECPRDLRMAITLWFTRMVFQTSETVVTSLVAKEGSRLLITCLPTGQPGNTGSLQIDLDLDLVEGDDATAGHIVFKSLEGNTFKRGPVVEGVFAGSNVNISSTAQQTVGDDILHQGRMTISVDTEIDGHEPAVLLTSLQGAEESPYKGTLGLAMTAGRTSAFIDQTNLSLTVPAGSLLKMRLRVLARGAGVMPDLDLSYLRIPAAPALTALPTTYTALGFSSSVTFTAPDQYIDVESDTFTVQPGDVVYIKVSRATATAGPDIHIMKHGPVLASA